MRIDKTPPAAAPSPNANIPVEGRRRVARKVSNISHLNECAAIEKSEVLKHLNHSKEEVMEQSNLQQVIDRYLDRDNSDVDNWDGFMRSCTVCKVRRLKGGWQIIELHKMGDPTWLTLSEGVFVTIKKRKFGCLVEFPNLTTRNIRKEWVVSR
ncbi:MAG: hypothetical protein MZW92_00985 [Comamonadaceae bacterium]|nr:hypothetical protein [Comamonadaceae bacterium]